MGIIVSGIGHVQLPSILILLSSCCRAARPREGGAAGSEAAISFLRIRPSPPCPERAVMVTSALRPGTRCDDCGIFLPVCHWWRLGWRCHNPWPPACPDQRQPKPVLRGRHPPAAATV